MTDLLVTFSEVSLPSGASGDVEISEDPDNDGVYENSQSKLLIDGTTEYTFTGFDGSTGNDIKPAVTLTTSDPTVTGATVELLSVEVATTAVSESGSASATATGSASETATATESGAASATATATGTETASATELGAATATATPTATETVVTVVDESGRATATATPSATESASATEAGSATAIATPTATEVTSATEAGAAAATATPSATETTDTSVAESGRASATAVASGTETATATEAGTAQATAVASATEETATGATESGSATAVASAAAVETATATEAGRASAIATPSVTAADGVRESGTATVTPTPSATESASATEVARASALATPTATETVTGGTRYQNEAAWLLAMLPDAWPEPTFPDDVVRFNRDNSTKVASGRRSMGVDTEVAASIGVSTDSVTRETLGDDPNGWVETTLTVRVEAKAAREHGTVATINEFNTLVARVRHALNTQIVYPTVTPGAEDRGRVDYYDLRIAEVDPQSSGYKDTYRTDMTVILRGRNEPEGADSESTFPLVFDSAFVG